MGNLDEIGEDMINEYSYSIIEEQGYDIWFDSMVHAPGDTEDQFYYCINKTKDLIKAFEKTEQYERCAYLFEEMTKKISEYKDTNWEELSREIISSYEREWKEIEMIGRKIQK